MVVTGRSGVGLAAAGLSLIAVCYGLARFAYGLFVPVLREEFALDGALAGVIASCSYAGYCVAIVLATLATQRWGARSVAVAAGVTAAAGTALIAAAGSAGVLAVGVVVAGSSTGLASPPLAAAVARWVANDRADRVQTVINAGTGLGVAVSGPIALLTSDNWRLAWWGFALAAVAVTVWTALAVPGGAGERSAEESGRAAWPPGAVRLLVAAAALGMASAAVWTFGRDVVVTVGGASEFASTLMWIGLGAAGLLGAFAGALIGRIGLAAAWVVGMLLLAAATAGLALGSAVAPVMFVTAGVFGAVYIALTGVLLVWGTRVFPDRPAFGVGAAFLLIAIGQVVGAPLVGLLIDVAGAPTAFVAAAAVAALGATARPR
ncbi:MFS transporter [Pseudonocardia sp. TRM90224]|uniref:MFS transporter n=1 Tax=Pseudonocardia sp. TRM90224 TaxID=2812678 RepID=UPI001E421674|nr:MFS transporter [Pseudonocardia sp. TRM90224]